ncbi:hypothetical protein C3L33_03948, partial [Rhododendron williamsianum]
MDTALPHKIWLKQQFSIGVNEVTRVLECMPPIDVKGSSPGHPLTTTRRFCCKASPVEIQVTFPLLLGNIGMFFLAFCHSFVFY